jgi:ankyrin repeat protein
VVKELIRAKANLDIKDNDGNTALIWGKFFFKN